MYGGDYLTGEEYMFENYENRDSLVYSTDKYLVSIRPNPEDRELEDYAVINRKTAIVEYTTQCLPKALSVCEEFTIFLEKDVHKYINYFDYLVQGISPAEDTVDNFLKSIEIDGDAN